MDLQDTPVPVLIVHTRRLATCVLQLIRMVGLGGEVTGWDDLAQPANRARRGPAPLRIADAVWMFMNPLQRREFILLRANDRPAAARMAARQQQLFDAMPDPDRNRYAEMAADHIDLQHDPQNAAVALLHGRLGAGPPARVPEPVVAPPPYDIRQPVDIPGDLWNHVVDDMAAHANDPVVRVERDDPVQVAAPVGVEPRPAPVIAPQPIVADHGAAVPAAQEVHPGPARQEEGAAHVDEEEEENPRVIQQAHVERLVNEHFGMRNHLLITERGPLGPIAEVQTFGMVSLFLCTTLIVGAGMYFAEVSASAVGVVMILLLAHAAFSRSYIGANQRCRFDSRVEWCFSLIRALPAIYLQHNRVSAIVAVAAVDVLMAVLLCVIFVPRAMLIHYMHDFGLCSVVSSELYSLRGCDYFDAFRGIGYDCDDSTLVTWLAIACLILFILGVIVDYFGCDLHEHEQVVIERPHPIAADLIMGSAQSIDNRPVNMQLTELNHLDPLECETYLFRGYRPIFYGVAVGGWGYEPLEHLQRFFNLESDFICDNVLVGVVRQRISFRLLAEMLTARNTDPSTAYSALARRAADFRAAFYRYNANAIANVQQEDVSSNTLAIAWSIINIRREIVIGDVPTNSLPRDPPAQ